MPRILIEIHEGLIVRDLLENGLLNMLARAEIETRLVTPGAQVDEFKTRWQADGVSFASFKHTTPLSRSEGYEIVLGKILGKKGFHAARRWLWKAVGEPLALNNSEEEIRLLDEWKPNLVVSTHLSQTYGRKLIAAANRRGIKTLGNLKSWDNVWKGLNVRPQTVTCWSEQNRAELIQLESYASQQINIIGAPAFDAYLAEDAQWTRTEFCRKMNLDPQRKIILFATLGQFKQQIDETNPLEILIHAVDTGALSGNPQIILRLHPWTREVFFKKYTEHPDVTVSRYENYVPGLTWTPTRAEAILAGNLMRHADVVVSPGSTMSIEPAIFDTPVVVPVFNEYMPEVFDTYFKHIWLDQHFNHLYKNDWLPIVRSGEEMIEAVNRAIADRGWYTQGRQMIRAQLLGPLDGKSTARFAEVIANAVGRN